MKKRLVFGLASVIVALLAPAASAQPSAPVPVADPPVVEPVPPTPPPVDPPQVQPQPDPHEHHGGGGGQGRGHRRHHSDEGRGPVMHGEQSRDKRPNEWSLGLGFGYALPGAEWKQPNIASTRLRLANGIMIEPIFQLSRNTTSISQGTLDADSTATNFLASGLVHVPIRERGNVDLNAIGGLGFSVNSQDPDGADNDVSQYGFGLQYGASLNYWLRKHWTLSMVVTNPLVTYNSRKEDNVGGDQKTSQFNVGLIWDPSVMAMVHLHL